MGGISKRTTRDDRERHRAAVQRRSGLLVAIDARRVKELLKGCAPATIARLTKLDRRQIRRLAAGALTRTHMKTLSALAVLRSIPVDELVADGGRPPDMPGSFMATMRAYEFVERWGRHHPPTRTSYFGPSDLQTIVSELLSYDAWTGALYDGGLPILEAFGAGGRPVRRTLKRLQDRRERFANTLADALGVLLEPLEEDNAHTISVPQSAVVGRLLNKLVESLEALRDDAFSRNNPGAGKRISELVEAFADLPGNRSSESGSREPVAGLGEPAASANRQTG